MSRARHVDPYAPAHVFEHECYSRRPVARRRSAFPKGSLLYSNTHILLPPVNRRWDEPRSMASDGLRSPESSIEGSPYGVSSLLDAVDRAIRNLAQSKLSSMGSSSRDAADHDFLRFPPNEKSLMVVEKWGPAEDWSDWINATG